MPKLCTSALARPSPCCPLSGGGAVGAAATGLRDVLFTFIRNAPRAGSGGADAVGECAFTRLCLGNAAATGNVMREPHIAADDSTFAKRDAAKDGGAGVDHDVVFHYRVAWQAFLQVALRISRKAFGTQRHRLIHAHAFADDGRLADDNAGAVVDEKTGTDCCAGMNVDAGCPVRQFGDDAR